MYKNASRFGQYLRERGWNDAGNRKKKKRGSNKKGTITKGKQVRLAKALDHEVSESKILEWAAYVRKCRQYGSVPRVPDHILRELSEKNLID